MLSGLFKGFKDLIYPNCCLVCKDKLKTTREQDPLCFACWDKIERNHPPFCLRCGRHLDAKAILENTCFSCHKEQFYFDRAFSPCRYTGSIKQLVHEFKYKHKDYLGKHLGLIMKTFIKDYSLPIQHLDCIIPIPLHKSRQREREFNQAEILSQEIAKEFNKEMINQALIRNKPTKTQTELNPEQRRKNVAGSFSIKRPELIKDKNLLLIDDVFTTGATSSEAAKCLKAAGAKIVLLMTLAN
ncbi:MAG: ComF family protein [Candidatus Omnitrophota bacterium]